MAITGKRISDLTNISYSLASTQSAIVPLAVNNGGVLANASMNITELQGIPGTPGTNGTNGINGITPNIGPNGHWWIGSTDTGISVAGTAGQNGLTPFIGGNGNWWIGTTDTGVAAQGPQGLKGDNGLDGITPSIGPNATWVVNGQDTGIPIRGDNGLPGTDGDPGIQGPPGPAGMSVTIKGNVSNDTMLTSLISYAGVGDGYLASATWESIAFPNLNVEHPNTEGEDIDIGDLIIKSSTSTLQNVGNIQGPPGQNGLPGQNGISPNIGSDGFWYIGTTNTGVTAQGPNGYTPYISNGYWYINGNSTGVLATGPQGEPGTPGQNGEMPTINAQTSTWIVNGQDTGISANGLPGPQGLPGNDGLDVNLWLTQAVTSAVSLSYSPSSPSQIGGYFLNGTQSSFNTNTSTVTSSNFSAGVIPVAGDPYNFGNLPGVITSADYNLFKSTASSGSYVTSIYTQGTTDPAVYYDVGNITSSFTPNYPPANIILPTTNSVAYLANYNWIVDQVQNAGLGTFSWTTSSYDTPLFTFNNPNGDGRRATITFKQNNTTLNIQRYGSSPYTIGYDYLDIPDVEIFAIYIGSSNTNIYVFNLPTNIIKYVFVANIGNSGQQIQLYLTSQVFPTDPSTSPSGTMGNVNVQTNTDSILFIRNNLFSVFSGYSVQNF